MMLPYDPPVLARYVEQAAKESGYTATELLGPSRCRKLAHVRHWYWAMARRNGHTVSSIARAWNRDHTTVIYALRRAGVR